MPKEAFIVRTLPPSTGSTASVTLPNGTRVRTLDRGVFERAAHAAETFISERSPRRDPGEAAQSSTIRKSA
jgi:hypothetical protein